jgi:hypothetical protein
LKERKVVDTNVLLVAEGQSDYSLRCRAACGNILLEIRRSQIVVLDADREILSEYGRKLSAQRAQPGMGYEFWKWLVNTRLSHRHCEFVRLTKHQIRGYQEFPDHHSLLNFDPADRKFVAVASAHSLKPEIVQAGDSKWWGWRVPLAACGIVLNMPCEDELREKWASKIGTKL